MQVSVEATGSLERRMKVQVPAEQVEKEVESRLRRVGKTARISGFRTGKVPARIVRQRFGSQIRREVLSDLVQSSFSEAIAEQKLNPAGGPRIEAGDLENGKDLEYTAIFEVYPEIELKALDGLKVEKTVAAIGETDIDAMIENLRAQRATWEPVERAAKKEDRVTIDFKGTLNGEPFEGGTANDMQVVIGAGQMLDDFDQGLGGLGSGETRSFDVAFPDDYQSKELAGQTARFEVTCHAVEERRLPELDEAFFESYGVSDGGLDALRKGVTENMQRELDQKLSQLLRQNVLSQFLTANPLELPSALVEQEVDHLRRDAMQRMGITDEAHLPPREPFEEQARRRVALGLLIGEVLRGEEIELDRSRVDARLEMMAAEYESPDDVVRAYRSNPNIMQQLEMSTLEEQVIDRLVDKAKVRERKVSFQEAMNTGA